MAKLTLHMINRLFGKILNLPPSSASLLLKQQGDSYMQQGQFHLAAGSYRKVIARSPNFAECHVNLGNAYSELGDLAQAERSLKEAIRINSGISFAHFNLGSLLLKQQKFTEAFTCFSRTLELNPEFEEAYINAAITQLELSQLDPAVDLLRAGLKKTNSAEISCILGNILLDYTRYDEALSCFRKAIEIDPEHSFAHFCESWCLLLSGNFSEGFRKYEWRFKVEKFQNLPRSYSQPRWSGEQELSGKTILIHSEQGLGDTIQFARYLPQLKNMGARIILETQPSMIRLFNSFEYIDDIIATGETPPEFDSYSPLLSLPLYLEKGPGSISGNTPYLLAEAELSETFRNLLPDTNNPRIGIVWSGSDLGKNNWNRSIPLTEFLKIFDNLDVTLVALQIDVRQEDKEALDNSRIMYFGNVLTDFAQTAALISNVDMVISIDTSVAHLSGAMNKPSWILLSYSADWRWFQNRNDSPWYPSATLYRQAKKGDWTSVIDEVKTGLPQFLSSIRHDQQN